MEKLKVLKLVLKEDKQNLFIFKNMMQGSIRGLLDMTIINKYEPFSLNN